MPRACTQVDTGRQTGMLGSKGAMGIAVKGMKCSRGLCRMVRIQMMEVPTAGPKQACCWSCTGIAQLPTLRRKCAMTQRGSGSMTLQEFVEAIWCHA